MNASKRYSRFRIWRGLAALLVVLSLICVPFSGAWAALKPGAGSYTFKDPVNHAWVTVYYYKPRHYTLETPVVFVLHGIKRNAEDYRDSWARDAEKDGLMILAPKFSRSNYRGANGYNLGNVFQAMTHLEAIGRKVPHSLNKPQHWAFALIERLFADFRANRETTEQRTYYIYGHGAGAQFVHRMMMFMPEAHVALAIASSAGWYTMPDASIKWPYGIGGVPVLDAAILKAFYQAPLMILIGSKDARTHNTIMRRNAQTNTQGDNRLARARHYYDFGKQQAAAAGVPFGWTLQIAPGVGHREADMVPYAARLIAEHASDKSGDTDH